MIIADAKLFAVYLGGRAPKGNTELHDVVFAVGKNIEATYEQLMDQWFGTPKGLHLDSWIELDIIDGYRITLSDSKVENAKKFYFVNLGAYKEGEFTEIHANKFLVAETMPEAKRRAKSELLQGWTSPVHTDDLYEVDSCVEVNAVNSFSVVLTPTTEQTRMKPTNGYHLVPKNLVDQYMQRHGIVETKTYRAYG